MYEYTNHRLIKRRRFPTPLYDKFEAELLVKGGS